METVFVYSPSPTDRMTDRTETKQLKKSNMHTHELMVVDTLAHHIKSGWQKKSNGTAIWVLTNPEEPFSIQLVYGGCAIDSCGF